MSLIKKGCQSISSSSKEVWPSSDIDHTDSPHDDLDTSHNSDNGMLVKVPDIDFNAGDSGDQGKSLKSKAKAKGRRGPGDHRNVDPGLDAFINANLLPEGDLR